MKTNSPRFGIVSLFLLLCSTGFSQANPIINEVYTENYEEQIREVYGDQRMQDDPELVKQLQLLLSDRVEYKYAPDLPVEKAPLISSVGLHNKNNSQIAAIDPVNFSIQDFNPLIYNWEYFSNKYQVFRIDGTGYILIVSPQQLNN